MRAWLKWHWKAVVWALGLFLLIAIVTKFGYNNYDWSEDAQVKTKEICIEAAKKAFGLDLKKYEATLAPIGTSGTYVNLKGHIALWSDVDGGKISCSCFHKQGVTSLHSFLIDGEDKTNLVRREERKE